jgi:alpha-L-rhamnosidase
MAWLHSGDLGVIREQFRNYERWEECLLRHSDDYIVSYSYYGDWAAPAYACESMENAKSSVTPGIFMSTGFSYYNCVLLSEFARLLGDASAENKYLALAGSIKSAMLEKWYDSKNRMFATGSMACQAFALWLGLPPVSDCQKIADALSADLKSNDYHFTTGNLCTKYLLDVLARYGHADDAYALVTREKYPSWGWMLQNEATTVWERFELKDSGGMNSYCHPMYGSLGAWFYSALAGLTPLDWGWKRFLVKPSLPEKLLSCHASVNTPLGAVSVRWVKRDGSVFLQLDVPFGARAEVEIGDVKAVCGSGHHSFCSRLPG